MFPPVDTSDFVKGIQLAREVYNLGWILQDFDAGKIEYLEHLDIEHRALHLSRSGMVQSSMPNSIGYMYISRSRC